MVKLYNPHTQDCSVTFKGIAYTVAAGATVSVPEEVADYWIKDIHSFLIKGDQEVSKPKQVVEDEPVEEKVVKAKGKK